VVATDRGPDQAIRGRFQTGHYVYEWEDREHEPGTLMRVRARITDPSPGATIATGTYTIRGKAWSGTGPVTGVHVSFTGEGDRRPARVEPPTGPYRWQEWTLDWEPPGRRRHSLRARATDAAGNVPPDIPPWNRLGYGNNAIEVSYVDVRWDEQQSPGSLELTQSCPVPSGRPRLPWSLDKRKSREGRGRTRCVRAVSRKTR
jgi:Mo-co oxidoreductase dimerisation domain